MRASMSPNWLGGEGTRPSASMASTRASGVRIECRADAQVADAIGAGGACSWQQGEYGKGGGEAAGRTGTWEAMA